MATILFAWELGGGLGHMMQMVPLARALVGRGHRVFAALRNLAAGETVFAGTDVCYLQAPYAPPSPGGPVHAVTVNFAHLLENTGWGNERALFAHACAWENLFAMARPDVVVFDHSPTALLASRGLPMRRVVIGSGFCVPPDRFPWPPFRRMQSAEDLRRLEADERRVLGRANGLLKHWGKQPLGRLGELYAQADETFLTTFEELEQYPCRNTGGRAASGTAVEYWGPVLPQGGAEPRWPEPKDEGRRMKDERGAASGRIFAYLKRFEGLEDFAAVLRESGRPTVLYVDGLGEAERKRIEAATLHVTSQRLDLRQAAAECDAAILHAGQGATAAVLLAGKPILQIPLVLEQRLTAEATARLRAAEIVNDHGKDPRAARAKLEALLDQPRYAEAARRFAKKYEAFDPAEQVRRMVERVEELMGEGEKRQGDRGTRGQGARGKVFAG